jgi:hypothetical protein
MLYLMDSNHITTTMAGRGEREQTRLKSTQPLSMASRNTYGATEGNSSDDDIPTNTRGGGNGDTSESRRSTSSASRRLAANNNDGKDEQGTIHSITLSQ